MHGDKSTTDDFYHRRKTRGTLIFQTAGHVTQVKAVSRSFGSVLGRWFFMRGQKRQNIKDKL